MRMNFFKVLKTNELEIIDPQQRWEAEKEIMMRLPAQFKNQEVFTERSKKDFFVLFLGNSIKD
jgi:hypothetical protein